jgi:hypothetical protein
MEMHCRVNYFANLAFLQHLLFGSIVLHGEAQASGFTYIGPKHQLLGGRPQWNFAGDQLEHFQLRLGD